MKQSTKILVSAVIVLILLSLIGAFLAKEGSIVIFLIRLAVGLSLITIFRNSCNPTFHPLFQHIPLDYLSIVKLTILYGCVLELVYLPEILMKLFDSTYYPNSKTHPSSYSTFLLVWKSFTIYKSCIATLQ